MQKIRTKQVLNYVIMPGVIPRIRELFGSGNGLLAFLVANIFQATRLLPRSHPYLNPQNMRKFGIRDVFAQAGSNLIYDWKHADQILVFFTMILGFILFILQFIMAIVGMIVRPAAATGMFTTANPTNDIAFQLMDRVFGVPDFFASCVEQGIACGGIPAAPFPSAFNDALRGLFQYYSTGLLIVAVIIFLYYIFVVVAETAQTGTPFGRRFSHIWAPIRLVVALGLLVPVSYGLNAGQYVVLGAAKLGSGFATNAWQLFNNDVVASAAGGCGGGGSNNGLGVCTSSLYPIAKAPDIWPLAKFMYIASTCRRSYEAFGIDVRPYLVKLSGGGNGVSYSEVTGGTTYDSALTTFFSGSDVVIRFGEQDSIKHAGEMGGVKPYCGEIAIITTAATDDDTLAGPYAVQEAYFNLIRGQLWDYQGNGDPGPAQDFALVNAHRFLGQARVACAAGDLSSPGITCAGSTGQFIEQATNVLQTGLSTSLETARNAMIAAGGMAVTADTLEKGWAAAGVWYNRLAEVNGAYFGAVSSMPIPTLLPIPMQTVLQARKDKDQNIGNPCDYFTAALADGETVTFDSNADRDVGNALFQTYKAVCNGAVEEIPSSGNIFKDGINLVFGTDGLFSMRENDNIHPLAKLVGLGKGIMDATVRNLFTASLFSFGGGLITAMGDKAGLGGYVGIASSILVSITSITLMVGFILYYVLPFLPFMYFFFAVGAWVKTIFEAMVGVPLWALGHMRIDGHGLPGESAVGGYYMIFEIFVRPVLTVFGLIGGMIVFTALANVMNEVFDLVVHNLAGFDGNPCVPNAGGGGGCDAAASTALQAQMREFKRDTIDEFFFTIVYTVIIYMMATSSFKMIDQIPTQIIRWMGAGVKTFADEIGDAQGDMTKYVAAGAVQMTNQLTSAVTGASRAAGFGVGRALSGAKADGANATGVGNNSGLPPRPGS